MNDLQTIARQLAIALDITMPEDEVPETFAGLKFHSFKTRKEIRNKRVTMLQGHTSKTSWVKARRAVIMDNEGVVKKYLGILFPMSDGRYAFFK